MGYLWAIWSVLRQHVLVSSVPWIRLKYVFLGCLRFIEMCYKFLQSLRFSEQNYVTTSYINSAHRHTVCHDEDNQWHERDACSLLITVQQRAAVQRWRWPTTHVQQQNLPNCPCYNELYAFNIACSVYKAGWHEFHGDPEKRARRGFQLTKTLVIAAFLKYDSSCACRHYRKSFWQVLFFA